MVSIHATAIVDGDAELGEGVEIGPFCIVGPHVQLGDGVKLISHVTIEGRTSVGAGSTLYPFASIGTPPQDLKIGGEPSPLEIGVNNTLREHVTMNPGTAGGGMLTQVGDNGLFMVGSHVAHDCRVGDNAIFANNATLGGHVRIGDSVILGGLSAVHQYCRIGAYAMIGGLSGVEQDVIPFGSVMGNRARLTGLNVIGLRRHGFSRTEIQTLRTAYRLMFAEEGTLSERVEDVAEMYRDNEVVMQIVAFIRADSSRSICQPRAGNAT